MAQGADVLAKRNRHVWQKVVRRKRSGCLRPFLLKRGSTMFMPRNVDPRLFVDDLTGANLRLGVAAGGGRGPVVL
jgi:hypothetical protein